MKEYQIDQGGEALKIKAKSYARALKIARSLMTAGKLRALHEKYNKDSGFFSLNAMNYFKDSMENFTVIEHSNCYELKRINPVRFGLKHSVFFDKNNYSIKEK